MGRGLGGHRTHLVDALSPNDVGRVGRMPELADLVVYLASPAASYITGAVMRIDGGWYDS